MTHTNRSERQQKDEKRFRDRSSRLEGLARTGIDNIKRLAAVRPVRALGTKLVAKNGRRRKF